MIKPLFFKFYKTYLRLQYPNDTIHIGNHTMVYPEAKLLIYQKKARAVDIGERCAIRGELVIFAHGGYIQIGNDCFVGKDTRIWSGKEIRIGNRVLIAHSVNIFDSLTHPVSASARHRQFQAILTTGFPKDIDLDDKAVCIQDDAWVGCCSIILRGVTIGQGAVIGAGSVVTKDVPAWTIVAGNPAIIMKEIPPEER